MPEPAIVSPVAHAPAPPPAPTAKRSASSNSLSRGFNDENVDAVMAHSARRERSLSHSSLASSHSSTGTTGDGEGGSGGAGRPALHKGPSHLDERQTRRSKIMMRAIAFFYHLSLSITFTVWTELLLDDFGGDFSKASDFLGMCTGLERGIQFLSAPFLGNLSDCLGRQPVMILSLLLHLLALLVVILKPNAKAVLAYYLINGISNVTWAMLNAIVADLSVGRDGIEGALTQQYGRLGMAVGFALIVGPLIGPRLQKINVVYPLYASMVALLISVILGYAMAESLPPQNKNAFTLASSNPFWALKKAFRYRGFLLMALPFFLSQMSEVVYQFIVLYTKKRLHWDYVLLGMYIAGLCLIIALVQGNLRYIVPRLLNEKGCVLWGAFFHGASMFIMGGAVNSWVMLAMFPPRMVAATKTPGLMGLMAKSVVHEDQGVLQGSIMSLRVLAKAVGSPLFGKIFKHVFKKELITRQGAWVTGITFFVAGGVDFLALAIAALVFMFEPAATFAPTPLEELKPAAADVELGTTVVGGGGLFGASFSSAGNGTAATGHGDDEGSEGEEKHEREARVERAMVKLEGNVDEVKEAFQL